MKPIKNSLNSLQYGTHEEFMDYKFPTNDEIIYECRFYEKTWKNVFY